jgi:hypothetical protein
MMTTILIQMKMQMKGKNNKLKEWSERDAFREMEAIERETEISMLAGETVQVRYTMTETERIQYEQNDFCRAVIQSDDVLMLFPAMRKEMIFKICGNSVIDGKPYANKSDSQQVLKYLLFCFHDDSPFTETEDFSERTQKVALFIRWDIYGKHKDLYDKLNNPYHPYSQKLVMSFLRCFGTPMTKAMFYKKHIIEPILESVSKKLSAKIITIDQIELEMKRIDLAKKMSSLVDDLEQAVSGVRKKEKFVVELAEALDNNDWISELYNRKKLQVEDFSTRKIKE